MKRTTGEVNALMERRMQHIQATAPGSGEEAEKLNVYRQQAALIARKKEAAAAQLKYKYYSPLCFCIH